MVRLIKLLKCLTAVGVTLLLSSCFGARDGSQMKAFLKEDLAGQVNGIDWEYKYAYVDPTIETPNENDYVFVFLPYIPENPCPKDGEESVDRRSIMVSAPKGRKLTKLKRGSPRSLVFHFEEKKEQFATVARKGKIRLTKIARGKVQGKLMGVYNQDNWVNGIFTAHVCVFMDFAGR